MKKDFLLEKNREKPYHIKSKNRIMKETLELLRKIEDNTRK